MQVVRKGSTSALKVHLQLQPLASNDILWVVHCLYPSSIVLKGIILVYWAKMFVTVFKRRGRALKLYIFTFSRQKLSLYTHVRLSVCSNVVFSATIRAKDIIFVMRVPEVKYTFLMPRQPPIKIERCLLASKLREGYLTVGSSRL